MNRLSEVEQWALRTSNNFSDIIDTLYANQAKLEYLVLNLYQQLGVPIPESEEGPVVQPEPSPAVEGDSQRA